MNTNLVYYLDDDADDLTFFAEALTGLGWEAVLFETAEALFEALQNLSLPSMVFLDINMPRKDGFTILKEIRENERWAQLPVVMFSTSTADISADRCFQLGASYYLSKPTCLKVLREAITGILKTDWQTFRPDRSNFVCRTQSK